MSANNKTDSSGKETRKRVFVTHAQVLTDEQRQTLTEEEKAFEASCKDRGVWLELFCPDNACFTEDERVDIPVFCTDPNAGKKLWLKLFCPGGSCNVTSSTEAT